MKFRKIAAVVTGAALLAGVAACSSTASSGPTTLKVAYLSYQSPTLDAYMKSVAAQFEKANPKIKVALDPINVEEQAYYTKLNLLSKSASTAPDVLYEDTFLIKADVAAGYLAPMDSYLNKWSDWNQFYGNAKVAGQGGDGKIYGVPLGTDTRGIWYNKNILSKAGVALPFAPKTWADVLAAAEAVKANVPGVTPINIYSTKAGGEGTSMQGFEMLLYGTGSTLYDTKTNKWVIGSKGFVDTLNFTDKLKKEGLLPPPEVTNDPNYNNIVGQQLLPQGKLAIDVDGNWLSGAFWSATGASPWPQWKDVIGTAPFPTQNGQAPGAVSLSGGWTLSIGAKSSAKDEAAAFIELAANKANELDYAVKGGQIAVRKDVAAEPAYTSQGPIPAFFASIVPVTQYRPAFPEYPQVSNAIQVATDSVQSGQSTPAAAAATYDQTVTGIVGASHTAKK
jgi:multiple sugar transport system substrate-binding protein